MCTSMVSKSRSGLGRLLSCLTHPKEPLLCEEAPTFLVPLGHSHLLCHLHRGLSLQHNLA